MRAAAAADQLCLWIWSEADPSRQRAYEAGSRGDGVETAVQFLGEGALERPPVVRSHDFGQPEGRMCSVVMRHGGFGAPNGCPVSSSVNVNPYKLMNEAAEDEFPSAHRI